MSAPSPAAPGASEPGPSEPGPYGPETAAAIAAGLDPARHPVFFYDGECGLCDRTVRFLLDRDREARLRFAPLQGETAAAVLPPERIRDLDSVVLVDDRGMHLQSTASLRGLVHLGGRWRLARAALWIPAPLRNAAYAFIARRRIGWFGGVEACRLPDRRERSQLLP
ncbi:MAG: thiol-disulfide oxidoreductase DCC family protein [Myxococcota bacterium]